MASQGEGRKKKIGLQPIDLSDLLTRLRLGIGQAASLCGVSIRQLSYWTDKGIVQPVDEDRTRNYDYPAIEKITLIKQALDQGFSLEGAVAEVEAHQKWQVELDAVRGIGEVIIGKQRHGPTGSVRLQFTGEFTRFDNLDRDHPLASKAV